MSLNAGILAELDWCDQQNEPKGERGQSIVSLSVIQSKNSPWSGAGNLVMKTANFRETSTL